MANLTFNENTVIYITGNFRIYVDTKQLLKLYLSYFFTVNYCH